MFRLIVFTLFFLVACDSDLPTPKPVPSTPLDPRDSVIGDYVGIRVTRFWVDTIVGFQYDTSSAAVQLKKSSSDSLVDVFFTPIYINTDYSFLFTNGEFIATTNYHAPTLSIVGDSLFYSHQPGLGPFWIEFFARKRR